MENKQDSGNRKRPLKRHTTYKLKVIFTQEEKAEKNMCKGRIGVHKNVTFATLPSLPKLSGVFSLLTKWPQSN